MNRDQAVQMIFANAKTVTSPLCHLVLYKPFESMFFFINLFF